MADCRLCFRRIWWVKNDRTGRPMPLDPHPVATGNVFLISKNQRADRLNYNDTGALAKVMRDVDFLDTESYPVARRYTSHFATCPKAEEAKAASAARKAEKAAKDAAELAAAKAAAEEAAKPPQLSLFDVDAIVASNADLEDKLDAVLAAAGPVKP
jgi:hypothetical protein